MEIGEVIHLVYETFFRDLNLFSFVGDFVGLWILITMLKMQILVTSNKNKVLLFNFLWITTKYFVI